MCCCCKWSYHPHNNMWFNNGSVSYFCGITALLKLFLCNSIIKMLDCICCSWPSHHFFSVYPENNYHFPKPNFKHFSTSLKQNTVSYPWHQLAVFTLFLSFWLCDWLTNICSRTKPSGYDLPTLPLPPMLFFTSLFCQKRIHQVGFFAIFHLLKLWMLFLSVSSPLHIPSASPGRPLSFEGWLTAVH